MEAETTYDNLRQPIRLLSTFLSSSMQRKRTTVPSATSIAVSARTYLDGCDFITFRKKRLKTK